MVSELLIEYSAGDTPEFRGLGGQAVFLDTHRNNAQHSIPSEIHIPDRSGIICITIAFSRITASAVKGLPFME